MTAPISDPAIRKLREIRDHTSLTSYLREELDWPIADWDIEDLTFEYTAEEAGLDPESAIKVNSIRRLRPLTNDAPWGIFFIDFVPGDLPITVLRRILRAVVVNKRAAGRSDRQAWQMDDLLFISALGLEGRRDINLARFNEDPNSKVPTLRVVEWDEADTTFHLLRTRSELSRLEWRKPGETDEHWRARWSEAFELRPREVVSTAKALASQMAQLAIRIRRRVNDAMAVEGETGPLRKMFRAFREVLLHDLTEDGFADMYAQTITYGLFAARRSRPMGITLNNAKDMVPKTNPFLRDLVAQFTEAQGLTQSLDFDELGVDALIATLNAANIDAVVEDWGRDRAGEDPVIHFYEDFLREYDKKQKVQRGVFFTPSPVVSFIVRSVHELLRAEFGLADGLASTDTWGDMLARFPELKLPEGATPETPFVQVLDPAVGTGTFLVEVIDVIHETIKAKWAKQGIRHGSFDWQQAWNEYVADHLLPRIYGFELMMASYTIAHMKVGLKLDELGYRFGDERLHIYLTNTLEPPHDFSDQFEAMAPALAQEARAGNLVKSGQVFTVIVGNPPYSKISANLTPAARSIVDRYRFVDGERLRERGALQFEINLQDDYVKFIRFCEGLLSASYRGILGLITNNGYISTPTLRGMRDSLLETFDTIEILDLHGHLAKGEVGPAGQTEENVFDIVQGVSILLAVRSSASRQDAIVRHAECFGSREEKYEFLRSRTQQISRFTRITPLSPFYLFIPQTGSLAQEWQHYYSLPNIFPKNSAGIITARDALAIGEDRNELISRIQDFSRDDGSEDSVYERFGFGRNQRFHLRQAQAQLRALPSLDQQVRSILYRPFDERFIFYHGSIVWSLARPVADEMRTGGNLALMATRQVTRPQFEHAFVTRSMIELKACSHDRNTQIFPLWIGVGESVFGDQAVPNIERSVLARFAELLGLELIIAPSEAPPATCLTPVALFGFVYAVLHSGGYRGRYFEFLRSEFPRIPITANLGLFTSLASLGNELVRMHLLEGDASTSAVYVGVPSPVLEKLSYGFQTVWLDRLQSNGFRGVKSEVWKFRVGGYQVCEKWLKDRKGRTLTSEDIEHYKRIIGAIEETIRIQKEIDEVIEAHGGWPAAFVTSADM